MRTDQVVARATGEADRFTKLLTEYARYAGHARSTYLDAEEVLTNTSKVSWTSNRAIR